MFPSQSGIAAQIGKGMGLSFLDFDHDGRMDVFVANDTTPDFLFHNVGNGQFRETAITAGVAFNDDGQAISSMGADARDFDNDGREDLFVTANQSETFPLFRGLGNSLFADMTYASRTGSSDAAFHWVESRGFSISTTTARKICSRLAARSTTMWRSFLIGGHDRRTYCWPMREGELRQCRPSRRVATFNMRHGIAARRLAIWMAMVAWMQWSAASENGRPSSAILRRNANHFLAVRLRGRRSNRDGIGAMIHVTGGSGRSQWNRVTTAVGYGSSSDRTVFFGMGQDTAATLEIFGRAVWSKKNRR